MSVFALVDCNNFYASCEKLFAPALRHRPVVVLSNNDGCVVARSAEARALDIPMGIPWFQLRETARQHGVIAFSANYPLYADMSHRVVAVLSAFSSKLEVYSIDESFLDLGHLAAHARTDYGATMRQRIADWLGLPVCVGIGSTKTLAKLANHCAKKALAGRDGVCDFSSLPITALLPLLARIDVGEVWGVGRRLRQRLAAQGINSVADLHGADIGLVQRRFSVTLARTVRELRGESCQDLTPIDPPRQQIISSRSFGHPLYALADLEAAVATFVTRAATRLRAQQSLAGAIQVAIRTNPFQPRAPQHDAVRTLPLAAASADSRTLTRAALAVLHSLFQPGYGYTKAGVMLLDISPQNRVQGELFAAGAMTSRQAALMATLDHINDRYGRDTLRLAAASREAVWQPRRENVSPRYTTNWEELPRAIA